MWGDLFTVARNEMRLLRREPIVFVLLLGMPLVIIPVMRQSMEATLRSQGFDLASGAEQAVPGQGVLFAFFVVGSVGFAFYREHGYHTWERLRASSLHPAAIVFGKLMLWIVVAMLQLLTIFAFGVLLFELDLKGQALGIALVSFALVMSIVTMGVMLTAVLDGIQKMNAAANLGAIVMGALGGALVPYEQLPGWAQAISPAVPAYWAMQGYNALLLEDEGIGGVILPVLILLAFSIAFTVIALRRFRFEDVKSFFN